MKERILNLIISHPEPLVTCRPGALSLALSRKGSVSNSAVSAMQSETARPMKTSM